jgi:signal transduction histidine kinase/ActR/RegA family two-component response regulator
LAVARVGRRWTLALLPLAVLAVLLGRAAGLPPLAELAVALVVPALAAGVGLTIRHLGAVGRPPSAAGDHGPAQAPPPRGEAELQEGEARDKAELVGRLAGAVAHDVNNTLTVVVANAEFLAEEAATPDQREAAAQIGEAARHAASLTQQMLVVSRKGLSQPRPVDVAAALQATSTALRRLLPPSIALAVETAAPAWTCIDPTQLHQLILNLAMNARDAMPEGGSLRLAVEAVGDEVTIRVSDTGTGMDEATQAAAFQPFFTTKAPGKGTGLGLANVQAIVTALGGRVGLASALGKGTTFEIVLPACARQEAPAVSGEAPVQGSGRVLVVDGDVRIRALATGALLAAGYDVLDAPDGPTGLRLAARRKPDLLVADAVIPGLPIGLLVEGYWSARPGGKVLVTTAFTDDETVHRQVRAGAVALLPKPFSRAELVAAVAAVLAAGSSRG